MIILDTNALLYLAGLEENEHIKRSKLVTFIHDKEVCISPITIFEILNIKRFRNKYSFIILNAIKLAKIVSFVSTTFYDNYFNKDDLLDLEYKDLEIQKNVWSKIGNLIIDIYCYFYSNILTSLIVSYFIVYDYLEEESLDTCGTFDVSMQKCYDSLFYKLFNEHKRYLKKLIKDDCFTEKNRNTIFASIKKKTIYYFYPLINCMVKSIETKTFSYEKMFTKFNSFIRKIDFNKIGNKKRFNYFDDNAFARYLSLDGEQNKDILNKIIDKIVEILTNSEALFNPATDFLYKEYITSFLKEGFLRKNNDLIDTSLVDVVGITKTELIINEILTLDNKYANRLKRLKLRKLKIYTTCDFK